MSSSDGFVPIASRPPPRRQIGALAWLQRNFFNGPLNTAMTLAVLAVLALLLPSLLSWGVLHAVFASDNAACRACQQFAPVVANLKVEDSPGVESKALQL